MTWKLCVWPKWSPQGPRWWKGEPVARGVANLRLVNFIIASGRATGAGGPVLSRGKAKRVPTHGKHARIHTAGAFLPAQAVAPGVSLTGYPSVCPSILEERLPWCWLEGCSTECETEGRRFISKRSEVNAEIMMLWMKLDTCRLLDVCIYGWIDGWMSSLEHQFKNVPLRWHSWFIGTKRPVEQAKRMGSLISAATLTGAWVV